MQRITAILASAALALGLATAANAADTKVKVG